MASFIDYSIFLEIAGLSYLTGNTNKNTTGMTREFVTASEKYFREKISKTLTIMLFPCTL